YGKAMSFSTEAVNSLTNIISLRTDVHRMFDERNFCFALKIDENQREVLPLRMREGDGIASTNIPKLFHNREAHPTIYVASLECLFARFAWTIFSLNIFRDFLFITKEPRVLLI
ncbi:hypothetical protein DER45DRAFT_495045, partial [Fusarium avenaceum]